METSQQKRIRDVLERSPAVSSEAEVDQTASEPLTRATRNQSWWWVELWLDKRELVKGTVAHTLFFGGLVGTLEVVHRLLRWSTLPSDELFVLNKVHFYIYAIILVIFAFSFILKVLKLEFSERR